ncbi:DUF397 domain-containing protein [Streptomyces sp. NPDC048392]|uniref:DUF397 domain-containing protein n=1 Tax=Streptomyces sp. NPDC048392 TaxID=3365543 RepID=UPI003721AA33
MSRKPASRETSVLARFKSSYSSSEGDSCWRSPSSPGTVHVRDSQCAASGPRLAPAPEAWGCFVAGAVRS